MDFSRRKAKWKRKPHSLCLPAGSSKPVWQTKASKNFSENIYFLQGLAKLVKSVRPCALIGHLWCQRQSRGSPGPPPPLKAPPPLSFGDEVLLCPPRCGPRRRGCEKLQLVSVSYRRSMTRGRVKELSPHVSCWWFSVALTAGGAAGQEIGHHLPFALDCDQPSVLQCVVVGAQDLLQVCGHLRTGRGRGTSGFSFIFSMFLLFSIFLAPNHSHSASIRYIIQKISRLNLFERLNTFRCLKKTDRLNDLHYIYIRAHLLYRFAKKTCPIWDFQKHTGICISFILQI